MDSRPLATRVPSPSVRVRGLPPTDGRRAAQGAVEVSLAGPWILLAELPRECPDALEQRCGAQDTVPAEGFTVVRPAREVLEAAKAWDGGGGPVSASPRRACALRETPRTGPSAGRWRRRRPEPSSPAGPREPMDRASLVSGWAPGHGGLPGTHLYGRFSGARKCRKGHAASIQTPVASDCWLQLHMCTASP